MPIIYNSFPPFIYFLRLFNLITSLVFHIFPATRVFCQECFKLFDISENHFIFGYTVIPRHLVLKLYPK